MRFAATVVRELEPGDEIVCTRLDHDSNVRPWVIAAERAGVDRALRRADRGHAGAAGERGRGRAERAHQVGRGDRRVQRDRHRPGPRRGSSPPPTRVGARVYVDAVHATPHRRNDLAALGADVIGCSAYKWFGPHVAMLCGRPEMLEDYHPDKLNPSPDESPDRWELGHAALRVARRRARRRRVHARARLRRRPRARAVRCCDSALDGLGAMDHVTLYGAAADRAPTLMFTVAGHHPDRRRQVPQRARDRRLGRQLLRLGARAGPRPRPPRRHPRRLPALQRRLRRRTPPRGRRGAEALRAAVERLQR